MSGFDIIKILLKIFCLRFERGYCLKFFKIFFKCYYSVSIIFLFFIPFVFQVKMLFILRKKIKQN